MKQIFKSDAAFQGNVAINKTLNVAQITEDIEAEEIKKGSFYERRTHAESGIAEKLSSNLSSGTYIVNLNREFTFNFTIDKNAQDIVVELEAAKMSYISQASWTLEAQNLMSQSKIIKIEAEKEEDAQRIYVTIRTSYPKILITEENSPKTINVNAEFVCKCMYSLYEKKAVSSYSNKISLYGADGVLHDIQERLDNLKSNFVSIGFNYEDVDGGDKKSSIKTLKVKDAAVDDIILPENVYGGEITSLADILQDIDKRIKPFEPREEYNLTGTIEVMYYNGSTTRNEDFPNTEIGKIYRRGLFIYGYILSSDQLIANFKQSHPGYSSPNLEDLDTIQISGNNNIPPPKEEFCILWTKWSGGTLLGKEFKFLNKEGRLDIQEQQTGDTITFSGKSFDHIPVLFYYSI